MSAMLVLLQFFILSGCFRGSSKPGWSTSSGAEQFEQLMWKAVRDRDWNEVQHHLAPVFVGVNAGGQKFDGAGWVEYWKAAQIKDFSMGDVLVQPEGPDMVVNYTLRLSGTSGNLLPAGEVRVISVWQQVKNGWVLTTHSETPVSSK